MHTLLAVIAKDLRLLWRDRAGLIFLTIAPIIVITVAGVSLANLYGSDPTGQTAYDFPLVDEDGGALAQTIRERLAAETTVRLQPVRDRAAAERLIRDRKQAGSALVIPRGTEAALAAGQPATLILYVDSVKYLERLNVRTRLLELRDALAAERVQQASRDANAQRQALQAQLEDLRSALETARRKLDAAWAAAKATRQQAADNLHKAAARAETEAREQVDREVHAAADAIARDVQTQLADLQAPLRRYLDAVTAARTSFNAWLSELQRVAGSHAADIPPPPAFPELPESLTRLVSGDASLVQLPKPPRLYLTLPPLRLPELPALPAPPHIDIPEVVLPPASAAPASLAIEEVNISGGPARVNTFDQNVPGFSVTFLLLGMLLGVSLGLLDERDWGTLDRLRAMPIAAANVLIGKLLSRFLVGIVQMLVLFAVGWLAFGISLGPQPWALALPTVGIVFAGTAFGLIVAAVATSREAVLPVGSIVIVTMAAVGGCWWPIDLEPRWMRAVALAFPTTWAMDAFNDLMIRRRSVQAAFVPTAVMLSYGLLYLVAGLALFRFQGSERRG